MTTRIPTVYFEEKVAALDRAVTLLADTNTVKFQRLTLATIASSAEAIKAEADKWIMSSLTTTSQSDL